jgi:NAD(P)-dependent dehydrogenase (short-subunit alcohol dehydrogenase family)
MPDLHGEVMQSGNVAVVTGSSSGIGRAVARLCAAKGMHVFLADIDAQMLPEAQAEIDSLASPHGGSATSVVTDVSDPQSVASLRDAVLAAHGTVHLLHCNAGLEVPGGVLEPLSEGFSGADDAGWPARRHRLHWLKAGNHHVRLTVT